MWSPEGAAAQQIVRVVPLGAENRTVAHGVSAQRLGAADGASLDTRTADPMTHTQEAAMAFQSRHGQQQEDIHPDASLGMLWIFASWVVAVSVGAVLLWGLP